MTTIYSAHRRPNGTAPETVAVHNADPGVLTGVERRLNGRGENKPVLADTLAHPPVLLPSNSKASLTLVSRVFSGNLGRSRKALLGELPDPGSLESSPPACRVAARCPVLSEYLEASERLRPGLW